MKITKVFLNLIFFTAAFLMFGHSTFGQTAPRQEKLLNGLKILMWRDPSAQKVEIRLRVHSGSAFDPQGKEGLMKLLSQNIFSTPEARDYFKDDLGGSLEVISNYDYIQINASADPAQFLTLLETVARSIADLNVDKETTARLKSEQVIRIKELEAAPKYLADIAVAKRLFGTFPYGRPPEGTTDSLARIDFADMIDVRQRFLTADNATVAISGNFDPDLAYRAGRRYFGTWLKADKKIPSTFRQPDPPATATETINSLPPGDVEIRYEGRGYSFNDKDFPASNVFARIVEDRLKNKVPEEDRSGIHVVSEGMILPGFIRIGWSGKATAAGKPDLTNLVKAAIEEKITEAEFAAAKTAYAEEQKKEPSVDRWLDIDTYKMVPLQAQAKTLADLKLSDVQRAADSFSKQPKAVVILTGQKEAN